MAKLVLFDLDQTLIDLFKFHNSAFSKAFEKVFNKKASLDEIDFAGKTIKTVAIEIAKLKGISKKELKKKFAKALKLYEKFFIDSLPKNLRPFLLKGASKLIKKLHKEGFILVLVSGGPKKILRTVLKRTGLLRYFSFIVSGEKEANRVRLVKGFVRKLKKKIVIEKIFVIGDSVRDIESGKAINAITIAVLTGFHSKKQLKKAKANYVFNNLVDIKIKFLNSLN